MRLLDLLERAVNSYETYVMATVARYEAMNRIDERMAKVREHEGSKAGSFTVAGPVRTEASVDYTHRPKIRELADLDTRLGALSERLSQLAAQPSGQESGEK